MQARMYVYTCAINYTYISDFYFIFIASFNFPHFWNVTKLIHMLLGGHLMPHPFFLWIRESRV